MTSQRMRDVLCGRVFMTGRDRAELAELYKLDRERYIELFREKRRRKLLRRRGLIK